MDHAHDIDVLMSIHNLIKYVDKYFKKSRILWQYCRDEPTIGAANSTIVDFNADNDSTDSFKIEEKIEVKEAAVAQKISK